MGPLRPRLGREETPAALSNSVTAAACFRCPPASFRTGLLALCLASITCGKVLAQEDFSFFIGEYRVEGAKRLSRLEVERAVYPYLGPHRSAEDVESARRALESAYRDAGFQTVSVLIPQQDPSRGVVVLQVIEGAVSRLRVRGSQYYLPSRIRAGAPSLAEGSVPNMNDVRREILALNRLADRRVKPELRPGEEPGTFEVDLNVEDTLPLHGSLELNNRYSPNTTPLRLNGALSYGSLFQLGHTLSLNFQVAPENTDDALVFSGNYLARVSDTASLLFTATRQDSDISTLGGGSVVGKGGMAGVRAIIDLPGGDGFFPTFSFGIDRKSFEEDILVGGGVISSPIEYYPLTASYGATKLHGKDAFTEASASLVFNLRGIGSDSRAYADKRFNADGAFIVLKGDISHTRDLKSGAQWFAKLQGQVANKPLINSEQFSGGGLGTARGYLESSSLGDNAVFATGEIRSPSYIGKSELGKKRGDELRFHLFTDLGVLGSYDSLPGQKSTATFASVGIGARARYLDHLNSSVDVAFPLTPVESSERGDVRVTFRGWLDF